MKIEDDFEDEEEKNNIDFEANGIYQLRDKNDNEIVYGIVDDDEEFMSIFSINNGIMIVREIDDVEDDFVVIKDITNYIILTFKSR